MRGLLVRGCDWSICGLQLKDDCVLCCRQSLLFRYQILSPRWLRNLGDLRLGDLRLDDLRLHVLGPHVLCLRVIRVNLRSGLPVGFWVLHLWTTNLCELAATLPTPRRRLRNTLKDLLYIILAAFGCALAESVVDVLELCVG
jgi:hypothetical protein